MSKIAYLGGKISGLPIEMARNKFESMADTLRGMGYEVVHGFEINQAVIANGTHKWEDCMRADIKAMLECDEVHMMPCWKESRGAQLERDIALRLGMKVVYH